MNQKAYFKRVKDYLEALVEDTDEIAEFVGTSESELMTKLQTITDASKPLLIFFGYEGNLEGQKQRTFGPRTISFSIVYPITDQNNYALQYQRINDAESIGLEVLARINYDSTLEGAVDWLYNSFEKDSCKFHEITYKTPIGLVGHEFFFDLKFNNALTPTPSFWKDRDFCNS
ncbi:MAG: hypothetical protein WCY77_09905 [Weeksellaceae bacterium]